MFAMGSDVVLVLLLLYCDLVIIENYQGYYRNILLADIRLLTKLPTAVITVGFNFGLMIIKHFIVQLIHNI